jgi:hypothetical protein
LGLLPKNQKLTRRVSKSYSEKTTALIKKCVVLKKTFAFQREP